MENLSWENARKMGRLRLRSPRRLTELKRRSERRRGVLIGGGLLAQELDRPLSSRALTMSLNRKARGHGFSEFQLTGARVSG